MDRRQPHNPQLARERAVYDYLEALDSGDIDGIIESLQQATYDAQLDEMLIEAHQSYFQDEQVHHSELADRDTRVELPAVVLPPTRQQKRAPRRTSWWVRTLAAVLIVGALISSFVTLLALHQAGTNAVHPTPTPVSVSCYPLKQFSQPFSRTTQSMLRAVSADAVNDAWAVGYTIGNFYPQGTKPLIEHWEGQNWQVVPNPANMGILEAVVAITANNVWAVGSSNSYADSSDSLGWTLIEHWDGKQWSIVPDPKSVGTSSQPSNGILLAITAVSANDIWALGSYTTNSTRSFAEHWDGKHWTVMTEFISQRPALAGVKRDIQAISAQNVWVTVPGGFEHWDGRRWIRFSADIAGLVFGKMSVISANDIWSIGENSSSHLFLAHWNGHQWRVETAPPLSSFGGMASFLTDIVAISDENIRLLGNGPEKNAGYIQSVILLHWNGKDWQQVAMPSLLAPPADQQTSPTHVEALAEAMTIYANRQMWIVGIMGRGEENAALIEGQILC